MEKSTSIKNIAAALLLFHTKVEKVRKDAKNPFFKSTYASLPNVLDAIDEPLRESGLTFAQFPEGENGLTTILMHAESGEWMQAPYTMKPVPEYSKEKDRDGNVLWRAEQPHITPQGIGSSITYQRRYALAAILGLNIDEDDDGNKATHGSASPAQNVTDDKPWLNEKDTAFAGAIKKLQAGTTTIAKIETVFKLSKAIRAKLEEATQLQTA